MTKGSLHDGSQVGHRPKCQLNVNARALRSLSSSIRVRMSSWVFIFNLNQCYVWYTFYIKQELISNSSNCKTCINKIKLDLFLFYSNLLFLQELFSYNNLFLSLSREYCECMVLLGIIVCVFSRFMSCLSLLIKYKKNKIKQKHLL